MLPLLVKDDNFITVGDRIANILETEFVAQVALAQSTNFPNPDSLRVNIYREVENPWEAETADPIIHVWWERSNFSLPASTVVDRQMVEATYNIDCYAFADGDQAAFYRAQRTLSRARQILMAGKYTFLGFQEDTEPTETKNLVWRRWCGQSEALHPINPITPVRNAGACRISFEVQFNEFSPQIEGPPLQEVLVDVEVPENGY